MIVKLILGEQYSMITLLFCNSRIKFRIRLRIAVFFSFFSFSQRRKRYWKSEGKNEFIHGTYRFSNVFGKLLLWKITVGYYKWHCHYNINVRKESYKKYNKFGFLCRSTAWKSHYSVGIVFTSFPTPQSSRRHTLYTRQRPDLSRQRSVTYRLCFT